MRLIVTIAEETPALAAGAIRRLREDHDGVEVRVETFAAYDPAELRAATDKPLILTRRGGSHEPEEVRRALDAGVDLVDVEMRGDLHWVEPFRSRVILSHHDFDGMPDLGAMLADMWGRGCAQTKLAVTPATLADNLRLLGFLRPATTLIGMGERGLYSRILAPFLGSELAFVSPTSARRAAPGQLSLQDALQIYGPSRGRLRAERVFAVVGSPAGHSLSPAIHNPLFREKGVPAAYTIASVAEFGEVTGPLLDGTIAGLSVTAPFKVEAFEFAVRRSATVGDNAREARAVNTVVNRAGRLVADNTDVDGFTSILARVCGRERKTVALLGAGGTARAALVALRRAGVRVIVFNRTEEKGHALASAHGAAFAALDQLPRFDGEIVIDTLPGSAGVVAPLRPGMTYVQAAYGSDAERRVPGVEWFDGIDLLQAQAVRQHALFMQVFDGS